MRQSSVRFVVILSAASFAVLGACMTLPGTLLPLLVEQFGIRLVEAGSMLALQPVGYLASVTAASWVIRRYGMRVALSAALFVSAVGVAGFGLANGWLTGAAMMLVSGLGYGVMEVATNSLLILAGGERRSNLLNLAHLFFGVGSVITPVLTAQAVARGVSWRMVFAVAGGVMAAVAVGWRGLRVATTAEQPSIARSHQRALRSSAAFLFALLLALYVGCEIGIGGWLTKYMVTVRGVSISAASNTLSLYWLGLTVGRLALSLLSHRLREQSLLVGLTLMAALAVSIGLIVDRPWAITACFAATGLGFSGVFPAVIALGGRYHAHDTAGVTSVMIAGAGVGGIVIPWTMAAIADFGGLVAGMTFYAVMCGVMTVLAAAMLRWLPAESDASK